MTIAPNRLVAVLTPLVFAPAAGAVSVFIADNVPGVEMDSGSLQAIFVAGATIAFGKAALWLRGWQNYENGPARPAGPTVVVTAPAPADEREPAPDEPELDFEHELALHDEPDFDFDEDVEILEPDFDDDGLVAGPGRS